MRPPFILLALIQVLTESGHTSSVLGLTDRNELLHLHCAERLHLQKPLLLHRHGPPASLTLNIHHCRAENDAVLSGAKKASKDDAWRLQRMVRRLR